MGEPPRNLPEDPSPRDVQDRRYVLEKVRRGEERAETEGVLTQAEVEERVARWPGK
jgi:hypothetical protein